MRKVRAIPLINVSAHMVIERSKYIIIVHIFIID